MKHTSGIVSVQRNIDIMNCSLSQMEYSNYLPLGRCAIQHGKVPGQS
jgi:hypothetical protein